MLLQFIAGNTVPFFSVDSSFKASLLQDRNYHSFEFLITAVTLGISKGLHLLSNMLKLTTGILLLFLRMRWSGSLLVVMILHNPLLVFYNSMLIHLGIPLFLQGMGHKIKFFLGKQNVPRGATELASIVPVSN